jgi:hypothetical protein
MTRQLLRSLTGAQERLITRNRFEAQGHNFLSGFFALDMLAALASAEGG